ncbi:fimbrial protein [Enterobacter pseudoroggenkampii]|uniref:fimbrial protein n=1 Tax=Enterobacter pseudoroggenkampii TaxID=2996112 RepID=UPI0038B2F5E2
MKLNLPVITLSVSAVLFCAMANAASITGTSSVEMDIVTNVVSGTCSAQLVNGSGVSASTIGFGDVYKSDIATGSRTEPLKIKFTNCSGVSKATVVAAAGSGGKCTGTSADGDSYTTPADTTFTGFEVWSGTADTGVLLSCKTPPAAQEVTISGGTGEFPMTSRIVVAKDSTINNVVAGSTSVPVTFTVAYP